MAAQLVGLGLVVSSLLSPAKAASGIPAPGAANGWDYNGTANYQGSGVVQLTPDAFNDAGTAWFSTPISTSATISASFTFQMNPGGDLPGNIGNADGIGVDLLDASQFGPTAINGFGGGLGFLGLAGLGVAFDTYQNCGDPSSNFVGLTDAATNCDNYLATNTNVPSLITGTHQVTVTFQGGSSPVVTAVLDGTQVLNESAAAGNFPAGDLPATAYIGFTSATGNGDAQHLVSAVTVNSSDSPVTGKIPNPTQIGGYNWGAPGVCQCGAGVGQPVNPANGDFYDTTTDLNLPATVGPSLGFSRTYDAVAAQAQAATGTPGPLGYGWTDNWASSLNLNTGGPNDIYTIAGLDNISSYNGGPAVPSPLGGPQSIFVDSTGNQYIADTQDNRIMEVAATTHSQWGISMTAGDIYPIAGSPSGSAGITGDQGPATSALLFRPSAVIGDASGDLYVSDAENNRIQEIAATAHSQWGISMAAGDIYTIAGSATGIGGTSGDAGLATSSLLFGPEGLALDSTGDLFIADFANNRVQEVAATTHTQWATSMTINDIYTVLGSASGTSGLSGDGGPASTALLHGPAGVRLDSHANLYVADQSNNRIQEVAAASGTQWGVSMTANDVYTVAGSAAGATGSTGDGGLATGSLLNTPGGVSVDGSGDLLISDIFNNRVQEVAVSAGTRWGQSMAINDIYTIAGSASGTAGNSGDGGVASAALLQGVEGVAFDSTGNLYVADAGNEQVRKVLASSAVISTVAGGIPPEEAGNGRNAVNSGLSSPSGVAVDASGDLYIADYGNNRVQEISASSHTQWGIAMTARDVYTVAGSAVGDSGTSGDGGAATAALLSEPTGVAVDAQGNLYIVDSTNNRVQEVAAATHSQFGTAMTANDIYTVAGSATGTSGISGDGGAATSSLLDFPFGVAVDASGDLYVADFGNFRIQEVAAASGTQWGKSMVANDIYTVAGSATGASGTTGDGGPAPASLLSFPQGVSLDSQGNVYIADSGNARVQEMAASTHTQWNQSMTAGDIYTVAGSASGTSGDSGIGGPATAAEIDYVGGITVSPAGDLYILDTNNKAVWEVPAAPGVQWGQNVTAGDIYNVVDSSNSFGYSGDGGPASQATIGVFEEETNGLAVDASGNLYIGDDNNNAIREVTTGGTTSFSLSPASGAVTVNQADGAQVSFYPPVSGSCQAPYVGPGTVGTYCALPYVTASLTYNSSNQTYTFITHPYQAFTFNVSGELTKLADSAGVGDTLTYSSPAPGVGLCPGSASTCTTVASASGRSLVMGYSSAGLVTSVTDSLSRRWTYSYCSPPSSTCSAGDLVSASDPMGRVTSYAYDTENPNPALVHDMLSLTRPNGQPGGPQAGAEIINVYDSTGRVTSQTDPAGKLTHFDYTNLNTANGNGYTVVTDPDGNLTQYSYAGSVLTAKVEGLGGSSPSTWTYFRDPNTLLVDSVMDADNHSTSYTYDAFANIATTTNALNQVSTASYNAFDEKTCATTPMATAGCSTLSPPAAITAGTPTISPPAAAPPTYVTFSQFDTDGNLIWTTQGDYNPGSQNPIQSRTSYHLYSGQSVTLGANHDSCTASAPSVELACATIDPNAVVTQLGYDSAGDLTSSATPDGNAGGELSKTTYGYDGDGEQTSVVSPLGNLAGAIAANFTTLTAYDNDAEVTSVTQGGPGSTVLPRVTNYSYDPDGNRTGVTRSASVDLVGSASAHGSGSSLSLSLPASTVPGDEVVLSTATSPQSGSRPALNANDIYTVGGTGGTGVAGDNSQATSSNLSAPARVTSDAAGDEYIADTTNNRVQEIAATTGTQWGIAMVAGNAYTIAGSAAGTSGKTGDLGPATSALLSGPKGVALDVAGNLYIADATNNRIQEVAVTTGTQRGVAMTANDIYTVAGSSAGTSGKTGDLGPATSALLSAPASVALDTAGNLYIADATNNRIQEVAAATGTQRGVSMTANDVYTIAGSSAGTSGKTGDGGAATSALLSAPKDVVVDGSSNLYIADATNNRIQEVAAATGTQWNQSMTANDIYTVAGSATGTSGHTGDGGVATSALLSAPAGLGLDSAGDLYVADTTNSRIQEVAAATGTQWGQSMTANDIYTVAGSAAGTAGFAGDGGAASSSSLSAPGDVALDGAGDLFIADSTNNRLREVAGPSASLPPFNANDIYTVGGTGGTGVAGDSSQATSSNLYAPARVTFDAAGDEYIADTTNNRIQEIAATTGTQWGIAMVAGNAYTIAGSAAGTSGKTGDAGAATSALLSAPKGVALDGAGDLYIADATNNRVQEVAAATSTQWGQSMTANDIYTVAGSSAGTSGKTGDGGLATSALLSAPADVAIDAAGNLYIADATNNRIQEVAATTGTQRGVSMTANDIYTIAGSSAGTSGKTGDGGLATAALLSAPKDVVVDGSANLYVADATNNRVQEVAAATGTQWGQSMTTNDIYTVAGSASGTSGHTGDGGVATTALLSAPAGLGLDSSGDLYIADTTNSRIQEVAAATGTQWGQSMTANDIYTIAGSAVGTAGATGDGNAASSALLSAPGDVALDSSGDLFITDSTNNRLREVVAAAPTSDAVGTPSGYTVVGSVTTGSTTTTVFTHTVGAGDTGVTLTYANSSAKAASIAVYSDVSATQPVDTSSNTITASGTSLTLPSVTTTHAGDELVVVAGSGGQGSGARWSSALSSETADTGLPNASVYVADGSGPVAPGATGTVAASLTHSGALAGLLLALTPAGTTVSTPTAYNADDQANLVTDPDGHASLTCYDGDGNVAQTVPPIGVAANALAPSSCPTAYPAGYTTSLAADATLTTWDAQGQKTSVLSPAPAGQSGAQTTTYAYDAAGNLLTLTAPAAGVGGATQVSTYTYDAANELLSQTTASGTTAASTTAYCYDPNGRRTAVVPGDGNTSGLVTCSSTSPYQTTSAYQTAYSYDSLGELVTQTTPATTAAPSGATTTYSYDPAGNQLTSLDANGVTATSTYSPEDWLTGTTYSGSSAPSVAYTYNAAGQRVTMTDGTGTSNYAYDPFGETTSAGNGAGQTVTYGYDALANLTSMGYPLGAGATWATRSTTTYTYDPASNLTALADFEGRSVGVTDNADGLATAMSLGTSGDALTTSYDQTDSPSSITLANGGTTLQSFSYADSPAGNVGTETDNTGSYSPQVYSYDTQSRVLSDKPGGGTQLNYGYDASGNPTTLPTTASATYDHASELTSSVLSSATTNYTYSADGQRLTAKQGATTVASGTYNGAGELSSYSDPAANMTSASYNGDGLRMADTAGGTKSFVWNPLASVPQILADSTNAYLYGPGSTPIAQVNLSTGTIQYLVSDGLGSVRGVVASNGSLSNSTAYDAWGNPETTGGVSASTSYGYAGAYTDATGLVYLIGRYYDPATGQFLSVDPAVVDTNQAYFYASDNPVNLLDPTGLGFWSAVTSAVKTVGRVLNNDVLPVVHTVSGVVAAAASVCAIATSATVIGGITCGTIALGAGAVNLASSDVLYAEHRESGTILALDAAGAGVAGVGSAIEAGSHAAEAAKSAAEEIASALKSQAQTAALVQKLLLQVRSSVAGVKAAAWGELAELLAQGARGIAALGFGLAGSSLGAEHLTGPGEVCAS